MRIETSADLERWRRELQSLRVASCRVRVCAGTGCLAGGSGRVKEAFEAEAARREGYVPVGFLPGTPGGAELLALHRCGLPLPEGAGEALCPSLAAHLRREGGAPA